jgi:hypothetical protein
MVVLPQALVRIRYAQTGELVDPNQEARTKRRLSVDEKVLVG